MSAFEPIPDFPTVSGEEGAVEFMKDGASYRLMRLDDKKLVLHRAGATVEQFELFFHNFSADGRTFDLEGNGSIGSLAALGATRADLPKLF